MYVSKSKKVKDLNIRKAVVVDDMLYVILSIRDTGMYKEILLTSLTYPHQKIFINCHYESIMDYSDLKVKEYKVISHIEQSKFELKCGDETILYELSTEHTTKVLKSLLRKRDVLVTFNECFGKTFIGFVHYD